MRKVPRRDTTSAPSRPPVAVIDVGSNSGRVMVYRQEAGGHLHVLAGSRASLRLVRELDRDGPHPRGVARAGLRGPPGLPVGRARVRGEADHRGRHVGPSRRRERAGVPSAGAPRARHHGADALRARGGPLRVPGGGGGPARGGRRALRPRGREPAAGPLPGPPPARGVQRAARRPARLGRVPGVGPALAAGGPPAPRRTRGRRSTRRGSGPCRETSAWWGRGARCGTWRRSTSARPATRSRGCTGTSSRGAASTRSWRRCAESASRNGRGCRD